MRSIADRIERYFEFKTPLVWRNIFGIFILHIAMFYTYFIIIPFESKLSSYFFTWIFSLFGGYAVTIGAHRLWTHKTFKAKLPLRIFIMLCYLTAGQYSLVQWARDHRTHHKFADTDADPHNAKRGFFFAHMGWLMMKRHPEVKKQGKLIDVSDLWADPVVRFQQKYFIPLTFSLHILLPVLIGKYILGESWITCIVGIWMCKYINSLHVIWLVNSWAHLYGYKPYNKNIMAVQTKLGAFFTLGEAWHNFHHTFPWDYRIGELGQGFQTGSNIIDIFAWFGWAYDLKTASPEMVKRVIEKADKMQINEEIPVPDNDIKKSNSILVNKESAM